MHMKQGKASWNLPKQPRWNHYGMLRKSYLRRTRPEEYFTLLMTGQLPSHLKRVGEETQRMVEACLQESLRLSPPPDREKAPLSWQAHMQKLKHQAEEQVFPETIYK